MEIQIISDLHLESPQGYSTFTIPPKAPYLALLGDIGNVVPHKDEYLSFLTTQLKNFRAVLFVPGNHESYHSTWAETLAALRTFEAENRKLRQARNGDGDQPPLGEFILLDRGTFRPPDHPKIIVLGCSLFSHIPPERKQDVSLGLHDFYAGLGTQNWTVEAHNASHQRDLNWLNARVFELDRNTSIEKVVILTHWTPTRERRSIHPSHRNGTTIESGFSTDLSKEVCFSSGKLKLWAFGHTHFNCDFGVVRPRLGRLRLLANQRGNYFSQSKGFDVEKVVEF